MADDRHATWETLTVDLDADGVGTLTLDRPDALNAFTVTMAPSSSDSSAAPAADDAIRAVVVTGAGRAFCAGMDLSAEGNVFGLDEDADADARGPARPARPRSRTRTASATPAAR